MDRRFWPDPNQHPMGHKIQADIKNFGWHITSVSAPMMPPTYAYSTGLYETLRRPELVIFGLHPNQMASAINALGDMLRSGHPSFSSGTRLARFWEDDTLPAAFGAVQPHWQRKVLAVSQWFYRQKIVPTLQCYWPDDAGRFPWEPGFDAALDLFQPLLSRGSAREARMQGWSEMEEWSFSPGPVGPPPFGPQGSA